MEMRDNNNTEKRRRKIVSKGPVLVRSVKPGQALVASYEKESGGAGLRLWKS